MLTTHLPPMVSNADWCPALAEVGLNGVLRSMRSHDWEPFGPASQFADMPFHFVCRYCGGRKP